MQILHKLCLTNCVCDIDLFRQNFINFFFQIFFEICWVEILFRIANLFIFWFCIKIRRFQFLSIEELRMELGLKNLSSKGRIFFWQLFYTNTLTRLYFLLKLYVEFCLYTHNLKIIEKWRKIIEDHGKFQGLNWISVSDVWRRISKLNCQVLPWNVTCSKLTKCTRNSKNKESFHYFDTIFWWKTIKKRKLKILLPSLLLNFNNNYFFLFFLKFFLFNFVEISRINLPNIQKIEGKKVEKIK